jgi:hypothetical protein
MPQHKVYWPIPKKEVNFSVQSAIKRIEGHLNGTIATTDRKEQVGSNVDSCVSLL